MAKATKYFRIRNWPKFQGYKRRGPEWIKDYVAQLDDEDYTSLTLNQRAVLRDLRLLYARRGRPMPWDSAWIGGQLSADCRATGVALKALLSKKFIELCPETVAQRESQSQRKRTKNKSDGESNVTPMEAWKRRHEQEGGA